MTAFGPYQLKDRIGGGGMAELFLARVAGDDGIERAVAIKRIRTKLSKDETFVKMFIDEARILSELRHDNIVQVFDFGAIDGVYYLAMELIDGADMARIQAALRERGGIVPVRVAAHVCCEVCEALGYAHRKCDERARPLGIVHRDVRPQNILVSRAGHVKLVDFGIAKARQRAVKTTRGKVKGKVSYMSPEQVRGMRIDSRSDIFSLGVVLHELLAGRPLFFTKSAAGTIKKVAHAAIPAPSELNPLVPTALDAVVLKALDRDVDRRYQSAAELREGLLGCVAEISALGEEDISQWLESAIDAAEDDTAPDTVIDRTRPLLSTGVSAPAPEPLLPSPVGTPQNPPEIDRETLLVPKMARVPVRRDTKGGTGSISESDILAERYASGFASIGPLEAISSDDAATDPVGRRAGAIVGAHPPLEDIVTAESLERDLTELQTTQESGPPLVGLPTEDDAIPAGLQETDDGEVPEGMPSTADGPLKMFETEDVPTKLLSRPSREADTIPTTLPDEYESDVPTLDNSSVDADVIFASRGDPEDPTDPLRLESLDDDTGAVTARRAGSADPTARETPTSRAATDDPTSPHTPASRAAVDPTSPRAPVIPAPADPTTPPTIRAAGAPAPFEDDVGFEVPPSAISPPRRAITGEPDLDLGAFRPSRWRWIGLAIIAALVAAAVVVLLLRAR